MLQVPAATVPVQVAALALSVMVTLPVGVPSAAVTVKFTVTACPTMDGSGVSLVIVVVVSTVKVTALSVLVDAALLLVAASCTTFNGMVAITVPPEVMPLTATLYVVPLFGADSVTTALDGLA